MKKIFYNSLIARWFLAKGYCAITLGAFVFTRFRNKEDMGQDIIDHENVHIQQWSEITALSSLVIWIVLVCTQASVLWLLIAPFVMYVWYCLEFVIKYVALPHGAYKSISFEQEARLAETDLSYVTNRRYFYWMKYIFRGCKTR